MVSTVDKTSKYYTIESGCASGCDEERMESFATVGGIVTIVLSLVIAIGLFFGLVNRKSSPKGRFGRWLKEFLNFRKMWMAGLIKFTYIFLASVLTIGGIVVMFYGGSEPWVMVLVGLGTIIFGNLSLRLMFEMSMIMIGLWENTRDIRTVLVEGVEAVERKEEKKIEPTKKAEKD